MITINLVPQTHRHRQLRGQQLTHEDRMLIFVVVAVLIVLLASYGYAKYTVLRAQNHLADLQNQIAALGEEQKLLDLNHSLSQQSMSMETNLSTAVRSQKNMNQILDDLGRDLPRGCVLTEVDATMQSGQLKVAASSAQFVNLVRMYNALSSDRKFNAVHIDAYQVPYSTGVSATGAAAQATMNLSLTWAGGSNG